MSRGTGDNSTGSGGSWKIQSNVAVCSDNIGGSSDKTRIDEIARIITEAGHTATGEEINPSSPYHRNDAHSNTTIFSIVGGVCWGTALDYCHTLKPKLDKKGNNIVWGYLTGSPGICTVDNIKNLKSYSWDWVYGDIATADEKSKGSAEIIESYGGWVAAPDATSLANAFLSGGGGSTGGSTAQVEDGFMESGRGGDGTSSPQFWNIENFEPYRSIEFTEFEITEEDYESKTATFKSPVKIDLTSGRVSVLIDGETPSFGGIILSREEDPKTKIYTYTCQAWMDRIMANSIYAVHSGKYTVYSWIKKILADMGIPDTGLEKIDNYDTAIDKRIEEELASDADDADENDLNSGGSTSQTESTTTLTAKNEDGNVDEKTRNPFKKTPKGIYDKLTVSEYIRTLLFDYGVHVRFYGDINGIPHFEAYDVNTYMNTGLVLSSDLGVQEDFHNKFDLTNIVTQVMVKNISAVKPTGEIYTSKDLLGVNLATYVGRMGTIVDNPTQDGGGTTSANNGSGDGQFVDTSGKTYTADQVLTTNGMPSCGSCTGKYGYKKVTKYWYNYCPGCKKTGKLSDNPKGVTEGEITCGSGKSSDHYNGGCDMDYCSTCGKEKISGSSTKLTEVFKVTSTSTSTEGNTTTTNIQAEGDATNLQS